MSEIDNLSLSSENSYLSSHEPLNQNLGTIENIFSTPIQRLRTSKQVEDETLEDNIKVKSRLVEYSSSTECSEKEREEGDTEECDLLPSILGPSSSGLQKSNSALAVSSLYCQNKTKLTVAEIYGYSSSDDENDNLDYIYEGYI